MGDELKVYIPRLVHPVLKLFLQDTSEQKMATQKVSLSESISACMFRSVVGFLVGRL